MIASFKIHLKNNKQLNVDIMSSDVDKFVDMLNSGNVYKSANESEGFWVNPNNVLYVQYSIPPVVEQLETSDQEEKSSEEISND